MRAPHSEEEDPSYNPESLRWAITLCLVLVVLAFLLAAAFDPNFLRSGRGPEYRVSQARR